MVQWVELERKRTRAAPPAAKRMAIAEPAPVAMGAAAPSKGAELEGLELPEPEAEGEPVPEGETAVAVAAVPLLKVYWAEATAAKAATKRVVNCILMVFGFGLVG